MNQALAEKLLEVRTRFCAALPARLDELVSEFSPHGSPTPVAMARIHRSLHELCGSAGIVGEAAISASLRPALMIAETCAHSERAPTDTEAAELQTAIAQSYELLRGLRSTLPAERFDSSL